MSVIERIDNIVSHTRHTTALGIFGWALLVATLGFSVWSFILAGTADNEASKTRERITKVERYIQRPRLIVEVRDGRKVTRRRIRTGQTIKLPSGRKITIKSIPQPPVRVKRKPKVSPRRVTPRTPNEPGARRPPAPIPSPAPAPNPPQRRNPLVDVDGVLEVGDDGVCLDLDPLGVAKGLCNK